MDLSSIYQVLNVINTYIDPKAVIAGGAALDIPQGVEPNDIDIYFSSPFQFNVGAYGLLKATFKREMDLDIERTHNTRYCDSVDHVASTTVEGRKYQFMHVNCLSSLDRDNFVSYMFSLFDIDLCKVALVPRRIYKTHITTELIIGPTGEYGDMNVFFVKKSQEHLNDIENKSLTVRMNDLSKTQLQKTLTKRLPKYQQKFSGFMPHII